MHIRLKLMKKAKQFKQELHPEHQLKFKSVSEGQDPEILVITCVDSRILPDTLMAIEPGEVFMHRNVGNIVPEAEAAAGTSEAAVIEFALKKFSSIKDIIICGHSNCGAMKGLLNPGSGKDLEFVPAWLEHAKPVTKKLEQHSCHSELDGMEKLNLAIQLNVLTQIEHLKTYPLVQQKMKEGVKIHGWLLDIATQAITVYDEEEKVFISSEAAEEKDLYAKANTILEETAAAYLQAELAKSEDNPQEVFSQLKAGVQPIWSQIEGCVRQNLWTELQVLYKNENDPEFEKLVERVSQMKLRNLAEILPEPRNREFQAYSSALTNSGLSFYSPLQQRVSRAGAETAGQLHMSAL
ncbi:carbonic anhydrase [Legionella birminghamensis]|uniref:carbonic anhydrase n=1 Tax=Legionella birminghamensis TaxID=28083 RepID=A0A378I702_9GAMM|nr:carbonic anhydrase [Legionella birminghamensis]KTC68337.1 carbonic anhydrase [Legionella birminghamensis]STX30949.1 carbonic anhydrase [Legionella birminghamensis]